MVATIRAQPGLRETPCTISARNDGQAAMYPKPSVPSFLSRLTDIIMLVRHRALGPTARASRNKTYVFLSASRSSAVARRASFVSLSPMTCSERSLAADSLALSLRSVSARRACTADSSVASGSAEDRRCCSWLALASKLYGIRCGACGGVSFVRRREIQTIPDDHE